MGRPAIGWRSARAPVFLDGVRSTHGTDLRADSTRRFGAGMIMNVLHVGKFYPPAPGGRERMVQSLCEGERALIDSRVLVANTVPRTIRESWRGVPVTRIASLGAIGSVGVCPGFPFALAAADRDVTV